MLEGKEMYMESDFKPEKLNLLIMEPIKSICMNEENVRIIFLIPQSSLQNQHTKKSYKSS